MHWDQGLGWVVRQCTCKQGTAAYSAEACGPGKLCTGHQACLPSMQACSTCMRAALRAGEPSV